MLIQHWLKSERAKKASSLYIALSKLISGYVWDWLPSLSVLCKCLHNIDHRQYAKIQFRLYIFSAENVDIRNCQENWCIHIGNTSCHNT